MYAGWKQNSSKGKKSTDGGNKNKITFTLLLITSNQEKLSNCIKK